jgi:hypothetical protein
MHGVGSALERCNSLDDNCNGSLNEGCPSSIATCCTSNSGAVGGSGGSAFTDDCPAGRAIAGMNFRSGSMVDRVQARCAPITLNINTTASPDYTYALQTGTLINDSVHGGTGGTARSAACSGDDVVIGITGRNGSEIDRLGFRCGRVTIQRDGSNVWRVVIVNTTSSPQYGGSGGSLFTRTCAAGQIATGLFGRAASRVDQIGLRCSQVTFPTL